MSKSKQELREQRRAAERAAVAAESRRRRVRNLLAAAGLAVVLVVAGPWMLGQLLNWTEGLYASIPKLVGG